MVQVVETLSEELQIHRDLLTTRRDDRAREIEELRHDVADQRQELAKYEETIAQLRAIISELLYHQSLLNSSAVHRRTTAAPVLPIGMCAKLYWNR